MYGHYYNEDVSAYVKVAIENKLLLYIKYLRKKDNVLKEMEVHPQTIYPTHIMVIDKADGGIKRLNFGRIFLIGLEVAKNA